MVGANSSPRRPERVVVLGASNVARGISTIVRTAEIHCGGPLEFFSALGHGRSYGLTSSILGRQLPGIMQCGIWAALDRLPPRPTLAVVTDVGNDLLYGASVRQVSRWVETCLDRLVSAGCKITLTELPLASIARVTPATFHVMRRVLFPSSRLSLAEVQGRASDLNQCLVEIAKVRKIRVFSPKSAWYGIDPIHVRLAHWQAAWRDILAVDEVRAGEPIARGSLRRWFYLRTRVPAYRRVWGVEQRREQPSGRLPSGTTVAFY